LLPPRYFYFTVQRSSSSKVSLILLMHPGTATKGPRPGSSTSAVASECYVFIWTSILKCGPPSTELPRGCILNFSRADWSNGAQMAGPTQAIRLHRHERVLSDGTVLHHLRAFHLQSLPARGGFEGQVMQCQSLFGLGPCSVWVSKTLHFPSCKIWLPRPRRHWRPEGSRSSKVGGRSSRAAPGVSSQSWPDRVCVPNPRTSSPQAPSIDPLFAPH